MAESAALLVDVVLPEQPVRQWVLSVPYPLRFLFANRPEVMGRVLGIVYRCIATHLIKKAGFSCKTAQTGAVTLIQRFGSALTKSPGAIRSGSTSTNRPGTGMCPMNMPGLRRGDADHRIEDPVVIAKILTHLDAKGAAPQAPRRPPCRVPPPRGLFD